MYVTVTVHSLVLTILLVVVSMRLVLLFWAEE
jgi:hypothetical protein